MTKVIKDMNWEVSLNEIRDHMVEEHNYHVHTDFMGFLIDHKADHEENENELDHTHENLPEIEDD
jgi:hypothetical protein